MQKYECALCGYLYDPTAGDPANGVYIGMPFDEIPDNWICPDCGAGKEDFSQAE